MTTLPPFAIVRCASCVEPLLPRELQEHVTSVAAPYEGPREVEFATSLPKAISGKIRRSELRERP